ncbi:pyridoxamine 5'-phosphate oxidase family protein [Kitasatospora herbaricolor]|uniref:Pyridoxamine 5'-phosphate oxidase family protein n=1 Tax=Kitasatospora herbaricolor TaxID=68217 RepID=A0ABZ1W2C9_9ACTN|nr:pyridoxamine 5'-phosphate oxidase family protein [Kitasatospora herbaricolor]
MSPVDRSDTPTGGAPDVRSPDGRGAEECTREQSLELLRQTAIGRLIHTDDAMPAVTPSCFTLDSLGEVVIPLPASWRADLMDGEVVGFQTDRFDEQTLRGWTVLVVGRSRLVTDPVKIAGLRHQGPLYWGHRPTRGYLSIHPELVTGRWFGS